MERNNSIDFFRGIAMIMIVWAHGFYFSFLKFSPNFLAISIARFSVPFFFASSGYLLYKKLQTTSDKKEYIKNFITKLVRIYVFFIIVYLIIDCICFWLGCPPKQIFFTPNIFYNIILFLYFGVLSISSGALWYLMVLAWGTLFFYLINKKISNVKIILRIAITLNLIGLFTYGQLYGKLLFTIPYYSREGLCFGLCYLTLGYYMAENFDMLKNATTRLNYIACMIISLLLMIGERSYFFWRYHTTVGEYFIGNLPLTFFMMMYCIDKGQSFKETIITKIGKNVIGIYVLHIFFIVIMRNILFAFVNPEDSSPLHFMNLTITVSTQLDIISLMMAVPTLFLSYYGYPLLEKNSFYQKYVYGIS